MDEIRNSKKTRKESMGNKDDIEYGYKGLAVHILRVQKNLLIAVESLQRRLVNHDRSKYSAEERKRPSPTTS